MRSVHRSAWLKGAAAVCVVALAGLLVGCSSGDSEETATATATATSGTMESSATRVDATLADFSVAVDPASVPAGEVRFCVKNTGATMHEFVIVKSDLDPASLPVYGENDTPAEGHVVGDVDEDQITSEGEIEDIEPGATKDANFTLEPGKYVLICNLPGHYKLGMYTAFTVE